MLQSDTLSDQRISPTPHSTPEPDGRTPPSSGTSSRARSSENLLESPKESRRRTASTGKRPSSNHLSHKMLTVSKSIGVLGHGGDRRYHRDDLSSSRTQFKRVQSGSSISNSQKAIYKPVNRSVSPPANFVYDDGKRISPPPPTSKPPPLPKEVKRLNQGGSHSSRATADSLSSEESSEHGRNDRHHGLRLSEDTDSSRTDRQRRSRPNNPSEHIYENRSADVPQFFPQAHPGQVEGPIYVNGGGQERSRSYAKNRPVNLSSLSKERNPRPSMMPSPPRDEGHPLDHVVNEAAYTQRKPGHSGQKKQAQPAATTNLSSYPWHQAHARKPAGNLISSKRRKDMTENSDLIQRGNAIFKKDMDEFHSHSDKSSTHSGGKTPLSPSTHTLTLPEDPAGCETFV